MINKPTDKAITLRQADIAFLFGVTRATVSQWVKSGRISTLPGGRIDPNRAAMQLAKLEGPERASRKILSGFVDDVRREFDRLKEEHAADLARLASIEPESTTAKAAREALESLTQRSQTAGND